MNKVILMGRLTKDPELRYTSTNNTAKCTFTLAVNRRFQKPGEERQADFIPIVVWGKLAEFCSKWFVKGRQVAVVGSIQTRNWDDNDGKRHYATEVIADEAYFADSKGNEAGSGVPSKSFEAGNNTGSSNSEGFYPIEDDDDLPF
jgi:single-strand DNA-binding protein